MKMIVFDLDGTLADNTHRKHFIDSRFDQLPYGYYLDRGDYGNWINKKTGRLWMADWKAYYNACDQDKPIRAVVDIYNQFEVENCLGRVKIEIWTSRPESSRKKTEEWLDKYLFPFDSSQLKMRQDKDYTWDSKFKQQLIELSLEKSDNILYAFEDDRECISIWRRYKIFVFNCSQRHKIMF